ncbi:MAG: ATPase, T2SS/T4P/T4SS family [archaeon]
MIGLNEAACDSCGICAMACQRHGIQLAGFPNLCRHCEDPPCLGCGAMRLEGAVVVIDQSMCGGCGECAKRCPYGAITLTKGKAWKCDLCYPELKPKCIPACPENALYVISAERESPLGWGFQPLSDSFIRKTLERTDKDAVFIDTKGDIRYFYTGLSELTQQEEGVFRAVSSLFKELARREMLSPPLSGENPLAARKEIRTKVSTLLADHLVRHSKPFPPERSENLAEIITSSVGGNLGPLDFLLYNDRFEEVTLNGIGEKLFAKHKEYGRIETNFFFRSAEYAKENIVNRIADFVGEPNLSEKNPILPATLPNGDRLHALLYPVVGSIAFTIRHFPKKNLTLEDLIASGTISKGAAEYLKKIMESGKTVFFVGATGTGKTTLLNALLKYVPPDRRILSLEEVREIHPPHKDFLHHQARKSQGIGMQQLIESSLRETPDRVVIGEVRTEAEIRAFLSLAQAGPGEASYATFHGETLETAIRRLKHYGISEVDLPGAIHLLVLLTRRHEYDRKLNKSRTARYVAEIAELKDDASLNKIFVFKARAKRLERTKSKSILLDQ